MNEKTYYKAVLRKPWMDGVYWSCWVNTLNLRKDYEVGKKTYADPRSLELGYGLFAFQTYEQAVACSVYVLECTCTEPEMPLIPGSGYSDTIRNVYNGITEINQLNANYFNYAYPGTVMLPWLHVVGVAPTPEECEALRYMNS